MSSTSFVELTPNEFRERITEAPIAYLPLGTLEWHGEHLPLGADGIQPQGFFERLSKIAGGIVLPMLFVGPDRTRNQNNTELYGMDFCTNEPGKTYEDGQLAGSAYWISNELFIAMLGSIMKQLSRAGFRIVVAHGHGPSTMLFQENICAWQADYGLRCFTCWGSELDNEGMGIQVDHAAMNETSLVMALRPDLVKIGTIINSV